MSEMDHIVAIDWRDGPDRIFFFFKESNTYSSFNIGDNKVSSGYPQPVSGNWGDHDMSAMSLRFGFTLTSPSWNNDTDYLWLFYYKDGTPWVCEYFQQYDTVRSNTPVSSSQWSALLPYFQRIVGVMSQSFTASEGELWILLDIGNYLIYDIYKKTLKVVPLEGSAWADLEQYSHRMITAVVNDHPTFNRYFYIFLRDNEYLRYEHESKKIYGPLKTDNDSWPGLPHD